MSRLREQARPQKVDGFWYLVRRVPRDVAHLEKRTKVRVSTRIRIVDDPRGTRAKGVIQKLDHELDLYWSAMQAGKNPDAIRRWEWACETARNFGFDYVEANVLQNSLVDLVKRMEAIAPLPPERRSEVRPALLGEVKPPKTGTAVSGMLAHYERIVAASLRNKSPGQRKRWRTTRERALAAFTPVVGNDKLVAELTHDDAFAFRDAWNKRVLAGEVEIATANKMIGYVAAMFREINDFERLKVDDIFHRKVIKGGTKRQRPAFDATHVQHVLLNPAALASLNDEARAIFHVVAELGLRPSEVCGLTRSTIHLDADIPYIEIKPEGRDLKTGNSERDVPLVGIALQAMRRYPEGFPTYRDKADALSAIIQKHLKSKKLLQRPGQTFYSLRHTFKDRLRDAGVKDELIDMLMGHATGKEKYGRGYLLKTKHEVLGKIAFAAD